MIFLVVRSQTSKLQSTLPIFTRVKIKNMNAASGHQGSVHLTTFGFDDVEYLLPHLPNQFPVTALKLVLEPGCRVE